MSIIGIRCPFANKPTKEILGLNYNKVLDIGCGNGRNMVFKYSVGIDLDLKILCKLKKRNIVYADAHHLPFKDGAFDKSLLSNVLMFVEHPKKVLNEAIRVSREFPYIKLYPAKRGIHNIKYIKKISTH